MTDTLTIPIRMQSVLCKAREDENGDWLISGPAASLNEDYDGEVLAKSGILNGLQSWFRFGAHVDHGHQFKRTRNYDDLIGKGVRQAEVDGVPWIEAKLFKSKGKSQEIWRHLKAGGELGFSLDGLAKSRDPKNPKHVLDLEIHLMTVDPMPKGFEDARQIRVGPIPGTMALAKALVDGEAIVPQEWREWMDPESGSHNTFITRALLSLLKASGIEVEAEKRPQSAVHFREGTPSKRCGKCSFFEDGHCSKVQGEIGEDDLCDLYVKAGTEKAVVPEARHTCPRCGRGMYCIHCHSDAAVKAMSEETRDSIDTADFAGPHRSFPIRNQADVEHAAALLHEAPIARQASIKRGIIRLAEKHGLQLPATWTDRDIAGSVLGKAYEAGDGVVQAGDTGAAALRTQNIRRGATPTSFTCEHCHSHDGLTNDGRCKACGRKARGEREPKEKAVLRALEKQGHPHAGAIARWVGEHL